MPRYSVPLKAGAQRRLPYAGRVLQIVSTGVADDIDLTLEWASDQDTESLGSVQGKFKVRTAKEFSGLVLEAAVDCTVDILVTRQDVAVNAFEGAAVVATIDAAQLPLEVTNDRGSPGNLLYVSGVTIADAPATSLDDGVAVAVTAALTAVVAADADRRELRVTNLSGDPVAIGGAGLTWAKRCIVLEVGDTWVETRAANLAIKAICNTGLSCSLGVQEVLA